MSPLIAAVLAFLPTTAHAATTQCGSAPIPKSTGGYWTCTFGDDFDGTSLNPANWQVMSTATSWFTQGGECYVNDPGHVNVGNGVLTLTATKLRKPLACGPYTTQYRSGMVFSKDLFRQTYGRFEVRAKFPSGPGFQSAFWMWPQDETYGDQSGEIDVAEYYGTFPSYVLPHIHIRAPDGTDHGGGSYCNVANPDGAFHTYTVEWLPTSFKFIYDGTTCWSFSSWDPGAPLTFPQPFDQPFFMVLQLALGFGRNAPTASSQFPARFVIDYARAWE